MLSWPPPPLPPPWSKRAGVGAGQPRPTVGAAAAAFPSGLEVSRGAWLSPGAPREDGATPPQAQGLAGGVMWRERGWGLHVVFPPRHLGLSAGRGEAGAFRSPPGKKEGLPKPCSGIASGWKLLRECCGVGHGDGALVCCCSSDFSCQHIEGSLNSILAVLRLGRSLASSPDCCGSAHAQL